MTTQDVEARALHLMNLAGYNPTWTGFTSDSKSQLAEWPNESEARRYANQFGAYRPCTVEFDSDLGWCTTLTLAE